MQTIRYRLGQVRQQLGFVAPLSPAEYAEVQRWLPSSALPLFQTMSDADQRHSLRVCLGLQSRGCDEPDMLAAALLHDVGKAQGRVPFWTRPAIVLGKLCAPALLRHLVLPPSKLHPLPLSSGNTPAQRSPLPSQDPQPQRSSLLS
ncbi:MAG TPA: HD domain-containing protein, partial [Ktedonosporobacter sp.]|nr:HD domain-containing protein [Ktedonosporobacter sp.]